MRMTEDVNLKKLKLRLAQNLEGAEGWSTDREFVLPSGNDRVGRKHEMATYQET
jgi:hypothetical protein